MHTSRATAPRAVAPPAAETATLVTPRIRRSRAVGLAAIVALLAAALVLSLSVGSREVAIGELWSALIGGTTSSEAQGVLDLRIPRTVMALVVGAALGIGGALIQAVTRNPLADPGILGVNAGAAFAVALAVGVFGVTAPSQYLWFAFGGALATAVVVQLIGAAGRGPVNPARVVLAGVAIGAMLSGITTAMLLADPRGFTAMRAWEAGSIADRGWDGIAAALPYLAAGAAVALVLGRSLNAAALGDDVARSLGAHVTRTRILAIAAMTLVCGAATAIAGPIAFVGLMVPHVARWITGPDHRWIIAYSAIVAPVVVLLADVIGRLVLRPGEVPVGIVTAFVGAPVLIVLVRRHRASAL